MDEHGIIVNAISPVAKTRLRGIAGEPDKLKPAEIAPGAVFLVSSACREGGWIMRASNGQFHPTRLCEAEAVGYPRDLKAVGAGVRKRWPRPGGGSPCRRLRPVAHLPPESRFATF